MSSSTGAGSDGGSPFSIVEPETVTGGRELEQGIEEEELDSDDDEGAQAEIDLTGNDTDGGSSVGSGGAFANRVDIRSLVDLTGDIFCRVVMTRKVNGSSIPSVCGNPAHDCRRPGHASKQKNPAKRGLARHYPALPGRTANSTTDGRMDQGPGLTDVEFQALAQEEHDEMDRIAEGIDPWAGPEAEEHLYEDAAPPHEAPRVQIIDEPTSPIRRMTSIRTGATGARTAANMPGPSILRGPSPAPHTPISPTQREMWYGLLGSDSIRVICYGEVDLISLRRRGAEPKEVFLTQREANLWVNEPPPPPPAPSTPVNQVWYGLKDTAQCKLLCTGITDLELLLGQGATMVDVFASKPPAIEWLHCLPSLPVPPRASSIMRAAVPQGQPLPPVSTAYHQTAPCQHTAGSRAPPPGPVPPRANHVHYGPTPVAPTHLQQPTAHPGTQGANHNSLPANSYAVSPNTSTVGRLSLMGTDPSTSDDTQLYNTVMDDTEAMDLALCPPGLADEDRDSLFEQCVDVGALPGTYRRGEVEDRPVSSDMEMFAQVAMRSARGGSRGVNNANLTWQSASKNALGKLKCLTDVETFIQRVSSVKVKVFEGQSSRIRRFLHSRRFLSEDIKFYLDGGLLPHVIRKTYEFYMELLTTIRQEAYNTTVTWKASLAYAMISYHAEKLADIRTYASDWRDCLLQNYIYLRDAQHKRFFSESMTRTLWRQQRVPASLDKAEQDDDSDSEHSPRCVHCKKHNIHHKPTRANCTLKKLTTGEIRFLLAGFLPGEHQLVARAAATAVDSAVASNPEVDKSSVLKTIRTQFGK